MAHVEIDRPPLRRRGNDRGPEREPAVAHVGKHVDVLHFGQQPDAARRLHVGHDPAGKCESIQSRQSDGITRESDARFLDDALRQIGKLLV